MNQETYLSVDQLLAALDTARREPVVIAGLFTSVHCPFCLALKREQLSPRMRSSITPRLIVIEFDVDRQKPFLLPIDPKTTETNARAAAPSMTVTQWGKLHGMTLTPTLFMLNEKAEPLAEPLIGYASRDFYAIYLEERIRAAQAHWQKVRSRTNPSGPNR
jgi:thioredoxin-related protein